MRELIAAFLPVENHYRLRLASRTMEALYFSNGFWNSRFGLDSERAFLAVKEGHGPKVRDAQLIYYYTNAQNIIKSWISRRKIRDQCCWFRDVLMRTTSSENTLDASKLGLDSADWNWKDVQASKLHTKEFILKKATQISSLSIISISSIGEFRERDHYAYPKEPATSTKRGMSITGLEIISDDQPPIRMGYMIPGCRVTYQVKAFKGFEVARSGKSIHALRIMLQGFL